MDDILFILMLVLWSWGTRVFAAPAPTPGSQPFVPSAASDIYSALTSTAPEVTPSLKMVVEVGDVLYTISDVDGLLATPLSMPTTASSESTSSLTKSENEPPLSIQTSMPPLVPTKSDPVMTTTAPSDAVSALTELKTETRVSIQTSMPPPVPTTSTDPPLSIQTSMPPRVPTKSDPLSESNSSESKTEPRFWKQTSMPARTSTEPKATALMTFKVVVMTSNEDWYTVTFTDGNNFLATPTRTDKPPLKTPDVTGPPEASDPVMTTVAISAST